jgi:hypothetical protein
MWMKRLAVLNQMIVMIGSLTQLLAGRRDEPPTKRRVAESVLSWSLPLNLGVLESLFFVRHFLRGGVGQSAGEEDRLRSQVAVAHLAFGVLGLLSIRFRGLFWFATIIGQAILLIGIAALNSREMFKDKMVLFDFLISLAHLGLLLAYNPLKDARPRPARRRRWLSV